MIEEDNQVIQALPQVSYRFRSKSPTTLNCVQEQGYLLSLEVCTPVRRLASPPLKTSSQRILFLAPVPLPIIIATNPVISVLSMKRRVETRGLEGGGKMTQVFEWDEQHPFECDPLPLALLPPLTVIQ